MAHHHRRMRLTWTERQITIARSIVKRISPSVWKKMAVTSSVIVRECEKSLMNERGLHCSQSTGTRSERRSVSLKEVSSEAPFSRETAAERPKATRSERKRDAMMGLMTMALPVQMATRGSGGNNDNSATAVSEFRGHSRGKGGPEPCTTRYYEARWRVQGDCVRERRHAGRAHCLSWPLRTPRPGPHR